MACATTVNVPNCLLGSKPKSLVSRFYRRPTAKGTLNCGEKDGAETASGVLEEADLAEHHPSDSKLEPSAAEFIPNRRCTCKPSYVTKFSKITFLHKSIEDTRMHLLSKRQFFWLSGNMIFLTVSKPRMSTQVRLVRAIPRIYLVCALHANAVAAKPRI